jgi:Uma2 family endonuclease
MTEREEHYTMADVLTWNEQDHRELIEGVPVEMPMPLRIHQEIRGNLGIRLADYARGKACEAFFVPLAGGYCEPPSGFCNRNCCGQLLFCGIVSKRLRRYKLV